jgi:hypothetical protein
MAIAHRARFTLTRPVSLTTAPQLILAGLLFAYIQDPHSRVTIQVASSKAPLLFETRIQPQKDPYIGVASDGKSAHTCYMDTAMTIINAYTSLSPAIAPFNLTAYIVPLAKCALTLYVK